MDRTSPAPHGDSLHWTVERYFRLVEQGVLRPDDRVELIEGIIIAKEGHTPAHASSITRVCEALRRALGERVTIRVQLPIVLGDRSAPEPDVAVVENEPRDYADAHPRTALLAVEVSRSSVTQDCLTKAALCARHAIPEYWLVDLAEDRLEIFRDPAPRKGPYRITRVARRGETIELAALPAAVSVDDLLPPPPVR